jgi:hypothetical protein
MPGAGWRGSQTRMGPTSRLAHAKYGTARMTNVRNDAGAAVSLE